MRVIAGRYGGRRLSAPAGRATRPTADRVREALFSILGSVEGLAVLDLFAGSGALGIEALSRGAASALLVDRDRRATALSRANLRALGVPPIDAEVVTADALSLLADLARGGPRFDLVFVDPPYSSRVPMADRLSERLPPVLNPDARVVTESDKRAPLTLALALVDQRTYGDTCIAIHRGP